MPFNGKRDEFCVKCVKYTLLIGAFFYWLCSVVLIVIGAWAQDEKNRYYYTPIEDVYDVLFNIAIIMLIVGCVMFIISACGFVGALRENICLLRTFYIAMTIIFLTELIGGILVVIFKYKLLHIVADTLQEVYVEGYQEDIEGIMDFFHEKYECCGIIKYTDWNLNSYFNCTEENKSAIKCAVPFSCCKKPDEFTPGLANILCGSDALTQDSPAIGKVWTEGCLQDAEQYLPVIGCIAIVVTIPQLFSIILGRKMEEFIVDQQHENTRREDRAQRFMHHYV